MISNNTRKIIIGIFMSIITIFVIALYSSEFEIINSEINYFYIKNAFSQTSSENVVTSIYLNYRVYDTFFEALMLLVSVIGIIHFSRHDSEDHIEPIIQKSVIIIEDSKIISNMSILLYPLIFIFGVYIIINGHKSPGGGFQGGAVLTSLLIIKYLIHSVQEVNIEYLQRLEKTFFLLIIVTGTIFVFSDMHTRFNYLNVYYLVFMNLLIGFKVFCGLSIVFLRFVFYESR